MILSVRNPGIEMNSSSWKRFEDGNDFVPKTNSLFLAPFVFSSSFGLLFVRLAHSLRVRSRGSLSL